MAEAKKTTKASKAAPVLQRVSVVAGAAVTANLGNYESYKTSVSLSEEYDVTGISADDVEQFTSERHLVLKQRADDVVEQEYANNSIYAKRGVKGKGR